MSQTCITVRALSGSGIFMGQGDPFSFPNHGGLGFLLCPLGFCQFDTSWSPLGEKEPQLRNGSLRCLQSRVWGHFLD